MTRGRPPWYHLWHNWSHWTQPDFDILRLRMIGYPDIKIQYRRCVDCGRIQLKEL